MRGSELRRDARGQGPSEAECRHLRQTALRPRGQIGAERGKLRLREAAGRGEEGADLVCQARTVLLVVEAARVVGAGRVDLTLAHDVVNERPVCILAEDNAYGVVLVGLLHVAVEDAQVPAQLTEICGLEGASLQFHRNEAVQLTIEEQQVDVLIFTEGVKMAEKYNLPSFIKDFIFKSIVINLSYSHINKIVF